MIVTIVHVWVKPERIDEFIEATIANHRGSTLEPGNLRFDVLQDAADPAKFTLYEAYATEADVLAHKETAHYQEWRDKVTNWMAKDRQGIKHTVIAPQDLGNWKTPPFQTPA